MSRTLSLIVIALLFLAQVQSYKSGSDTPTSADASYLEGLTDADLHKILEERSIPVSRQATREELMSRVLKSDEAEEQQHDPQPTKEGGSGQRHVVRFLICTG